MTTTPRPSMADYGQQALQRLRLFYNPVDGRFEDVYQSTSKDAGSSQPLLAETQADSEHQLQQTHHRNKVVENILRDTFAGTCVSLIGLPMSIGFAIASGLHPIHALAGSIIAPLVNCVFGASKYTVLGSTAALSPILFTLMSKFQPSAAEAEQMTEHELHQSYHDAYNMLCVAGLTAGAIMLAMALAGLGRYAEKVPHSIIVGFTVGLGITIGLAQLSDVVSLPPDVHLPKPILERTFSILEHWQLINVYSVAIALLTFTLIKLLLSVSPFIPSPLLVLAFTTWINAHSMQWFNVSPLTTIADRFGAINSLGVEYFGVNFHAVPTLSGSLLMTVAYAVIGIIVVCSVESLLCSRMADQLAQNQGTHFNSDKELHAQGILQIVSCLMNSFPSTGALARTATNVKLNACSPLSAIAQAASAALLLGFAGAQLGEIPLPAIAGVLLYISSNMISVKEVRSVLHLNSSLHTCLMLYTSITLVLTDFSTAVVSACIIYYAYIRVFGDDLIDYEPCVHADSANVSPHRRLHNLRRSGSHDTDLNLESQCELHGTPQLTPRYGTFGDAK